MSYAIKVTYANGHTEYVRDYACMRAYFKFRNEAQWAMSQLEAMAKSRKEISDYATRTYRVVRLK